MKKKALVLILAISLAMQLSSASLSYSCLNQTHLYESTKEMTEGSEKLIEGTNIALIEADESSALGRMLAEIIIDTQEILLPNVTSSETLKLSSGDYALKAINASSEQMLISVNGVSGSLEKKELKQIDSIWIYLKNFEGTYPNTININLFAGNYATLLSNDEKPFENFSINRTNYLIELISASDSDATISVKRCEGSAVIRKEERQKPLMQNKTQANPAPVNNSNSLTQIILNNTNKTNQTEPTQPQKECNITGEIKKMPKNFASLCSWHRVFMQNFLPSAPAFSISPNLTPCQEQGVFNDLEIKESKYCNESGNYEEKKEKALPCTNNYECLSEKCRAQKCASLGFFEKLWSWIKGLI